MSVQEIEEVHEGRGGYIEYRGSRYDIDLVGPGHFSIHFPSGNKHNNLQEHLDVLKEFAENKKPKWHVGNNSRKYK